MRFGQTVDQMARDVIYPHPALSEVVENALLDLVAALDRTAG
jgi:mycothione reductase